MVGHDLSSCTAEVEAMPFEVDGFRGSIIDTPGFDDTQLTDTEVLHRISNWMDLTLVPQRSTPGSRDTPMPGRH